MEPGHGDLWKERWLWSREGGRYSMWWAVRAPGWIQIPQGESWHSASPWVQHQF